MVSGRQRRLRLATAASVALALLPLPAFAAAPTVEDIVEMTTIDGLAVSPDGKLVAFRTFRRSVAENRSWLEWYVAPIDGSAGPRRLDAPSEPIWFPLYDAASPPDAIWAPAGDALYVRGLKESSIQIYRLPLSGAAQQITDDDADVQSFGLAASGDAIDYRVRSDRQEIDRLQAREAEMGIAIDGSVSLEGLRLTRAFRIGERETSLRYSAHSEAQEAFAGPLRSKHIAIGGTSTPAAKSGDEAAAVPESDLTAKLVPFPGSPTRFSDSLPVFIEATDAAGRSYRCDAPICSGYKSNVTGIFPMPDREIALLHEAATSGRTIVYRWNVRSGKVRKIRDPQGSLNGGGLFPAPCQRSDNNLLCVYAAPMTPPRLVRVDLRSGAMTTLFAPNDRLERMDLGTARFLTWSDDEGRVATGTLFLPKNTLPRLPLVITTNSCRGFPRGGASNIISEHVLAASGFAALCINANRDNHLDPTIESGESVLGPHRAAVASYAAIIARLDREKIIDPARVGIAGHSFSANVATYAISHSKLFHAAALGGASNIDPWADRLVNADLASARGRGLRQSFLNLPPYDKDPTGVWEEYSPARNADRIDAPLLMQLPEIEYALTLELLTEIRRHGGIADLYVFPNEGHWLGREPRHEYWKQLRSLSWFSFWLEGSAPRLPALDQDLERWHSLRSARNLQPAP